MHHVTSASLALLILVPVLAGAQGMPLWAILILPVFYLIVGYIMTVIICALYNVLAPMTGGIEYESNPGTA